MENLACEPDVEGWGFEEQGDWPREAGPTRRSRGLKAEPGDMAKERGRAPGLKGWPLRAYEGGSR